MTEFSEITAWKRTLDKMRETREHVFQDTGKELFVAQEKASDAMRRWLDGVAEALEGMPFRVWFESKNNVYACFNVCLRLRHGTTSSGAVMVSRDEKWVVASTSESNASYDDLFIDVSLLEGIPLSNYVSCSSDPAGTVLVNTVYAHWQDFKKCVMTKIKDRLEQLAKREEESVRGQLARLEYAKEIANE